jgi:hypothetical protein
MSTVSSCIVLCLADIAVAAVVCVDTRLCSASAVDTIVSSAFAGDVKQFNTLVLLTVQ